jgi:hypothetical protein
MSPFLSRKFLQAVFVQITGATALFIGKIDGGTYVALSSLALAIHAAGSVADKRLNPDQQS